ncbi:MAG: 4a-hydroxytetrahydrobiopterin dehydratase [Planctomycetota bacterium]
MAEALPAEQIEQALGSLPGWSLEEDKLKKTFSFDSFKEAMGFMVRVGFEAEAHGHHPELFNVYSKVEVGLSTHDAGGQVTAKDTALAEAIESVNWIPQK